MDNQDRPKATENLACWSIVDHLTKAISLANNLKMYDVSTALVIMISKLRDGKPLNDDAVWKL